MSNQSISNMLSGTNFSKLSGMDSLACKNRPCSPFSTSLSLCSNADADSDDFTALSRDSMQSAGDFFRSSDCSATAPPDVLSPPPEEPKITSDMRLRALMQQHMQSFNAEPNSNHNGLSTGIAMNDYHRSKNFDLQIDTTMRRSLHSPFSSSNSLLGASLSSMSFDRPSTGKAFSMDSPNAMHQVSALSPQYMHAWHAVQSSRSISMSPTMKLHGGINGFESHSMSPQYHHHAIHASTMAVETNNALVYQVQFKLSIRYCTSTQPAHHNVGDFVTVDMNPGFNVGIVTEIYAMSDFLHRKLDAIRAMPFVEPEDCLLHSIVNTASHFERQQLPEKFKKEEDIKSYVEKLTYIVHKLPMIIEDVECQFDKSKMTIYYRADYRIDFRELVKNIFAMYKVRIWMKRIAKENVMRLNGNAAVALASGMNVSSNREHHGF